MSDTILHLDEARERAARVKAYASDPARLFAIDAPEKDAFPADDPGNVFETGSYRAVFSLVRDVDGTIYRRMSVNIPGAAKDKAPSPAAVFTLATLLGFVGGHVRGDGITDRPGEDWVIEQQASGTATWVVVVQVVTGGV